MSLPNEAEIQQRLKEAAEFYANDCLKELLRRKEGLMGQVRLLETEIKDFNFDKHVDEWYMK